MKKGKEQCIIRKGETIVTLIMSGTQAVALRELYGRMTPQQTTVFISREQHDDLYLVWDKLDNALNENGLL